MVVEYNPGKGNYNEEVDYFVDERQAKVIEQYVKMRFPEPGKVYIKGSSYEARVDGEPRVIEELMREFPFLEGEVFIKSNGQYSLRLSKNSEFRKTTYGLNMKPVSSIQTTTLDKKLNDFFS